MKIQLLLTGNELMAGHIVDSNSAMIADALATHGLTISKKVTVGDELQTLVDEIRSLSSSADILIINGGLGPTVDDLTAQALADATGDPLVEHATALSHLQQWCDARQLSLNEANRKQAILPNHSTIIANPIGSAVGFSVEFNNCLIACTPGVPSELKAILDDSLVETIQQRCPNQQHYNIHRLQTFGIGESSLQQMVNDALADWPDDIELGFRAGFPLLEVKLSTLLATTDTRFTQWQNRLQRLIRDEVIGRDQITLAQCLVELLMARGKTLTTAESCTGGLIASMLTEVAGASAVFHAGLVTYSNEMKESLLGVERITLEQYGAVSEEVVIEMFTGALRVSQADYAIAVTGVAGPDGGSKDKPVGTVWIAWGSKERMQTRKMQLNNSRSWFQKMVAACCLDLVRRDLQEITDPPRYFQRY
jgi:nicotinamide-nucleotide amidase